MHSEPGLGVWGLHLHSDRTSKASRGEDVLALCGLGLESRSLLEVEAL